MHGNGDLESSISSTCNKPQKHGASCMDLGMAWWYIIDAALRIWLVAGIRN